MRFPISIEQRGCGWVVYEWGRSAPILRPVPGNTMPALAAEWPTPEAAFNGVAELLGFSTLDLDVVRILDADQHPVANPYRAQP